VPHGHQAKVQIHVGDGQPDDLTRAYAGFGHQSHDRFVAAVPQALALAGIAVCRNPFAESPGHLQRRNSRLIDKLPKLGVSG
jgi:hypothetical protein